MTIESDYAFVKRLIDDIRKQHPSIDLAERLVQQSEKLIAEYDKIAPYLNPPPRTYTATKTTWGQNPNGNGEDQQ